MAVIKGSKVRVLVGDGGSPEDFDIIIGSREANISLGGDEIDTTTADDIADGVTWRTSMSGMADLNISGQFLIKDEATYQRIIADRLTDVIRNYRAEVVGYGTFAGPGRVTIADISGPFDGAASYSVTVRAAAAWQHFPETVAPVNTVLPAVSGVAQVGQVLTAWKGIWTGGGLTFTYQWQELISAVWTSIAGATAQQYAPVAGSVGRALRVRVTATNAAGAVTADSVPTAALLAE
jgi:predicted secreted protein